MEIDRLRSESVFMVTFFEMHRSACGAGSLET